MMACSLDDKVACMEVWRKLSGEETTPGQWNDKAIQALVDLVAENRRCSSNMKYVPQPALMPTKSWFLKQALRPLKDWLMGGTATYEICKTFRYAQLKNIVETALATGE